MPWKMKDAPAFTAKAKTPKAKKQWSKVANKVLAQTGDEVKAIKIASGVVKKQAKKVKPIKKSNG